MKYISKNIKDFEKLSYKGYVWKRSKYEPPESYFYLSSQLAKCMMRADSLNLHVDPIRSEMSGTQQIVVIFMRSNQKGTLRTKTNCKSVL